MSETKQVNIQFEFESSRGTWMALGSAAGLLVAAILGAVTLGIAWATFDIQGSELSYEMFEMSAQGSNTEYSSDDLDSFDGVGLLRAAGPIAITGMALAFAGTVVLGLSLFMRRFRLTLVGSIIASLAAVLMILAVVFFPLGASQFHDDFWGEAGAFGGFEASGLTWVAGLILGIVGAVLAIGAAVTGFLAGRDPALS